MLYYLNEGRRYPRKLYCILESRRLLRLLSTEDILSHIELLLAIDQFVQAS